MCKGQDPPHFSRNSSTDAPLRRVAEAEEELAVTRARLAASVEALRRERERAADLLRRLEESLAERERLRKVVVVMDMVRAHLIEARLREIRDLLQRVAARDPGSIHAKGRKKHICVSAVHGSRAHQRSTGAVHVLVHGHGSQGRAFPGFDPDISRCVSNCIGSFQHVSETVSEG